MATHLVQERLVAGERPVGFSIAVKSGRHILEVVNYPGHQGPGIENNVTVIFTPEGMSFCQMGDQWIEEGDEADWDWIDHVAEHHQVDVLLPNCWVTDIVRVVRGFNPRLVITGHENEMGHSIDHREPYWLTYQRKQGSERFGENPDVGYKHPLVVMTWGESFLYHPLP